MKSQDPFGMRPVWDAILDIYQEFARVCDKHRLRYYFMEGNAIGALRHKGFVPWDDDIDVAMPRPDYEKFKSLIKHELPSHLRFWDWQDTEDKDGWQYTFGKIQDVREARVVEVEKKVGHLLSNGLYIDILVIDGFPTGRMRQVFYKIRMHALGAMIRHLVTAFKVQTRAGKAMWLYGMVLSLLSGTRSSKAVLSKIDHLMKSVDFEQAKTTWRAGAALRVTMTFPRSVWNGVHQVAFDEIQVPLPAGYDCYLRTQYGDYMKLPPKEKQVPSHSLPERTKWWLGPQGEA